MCAPPRGVGLVPGKSQNLKKLNRKDTSARTERMGDERFTGIENELKAYKTLLDGGVSDEK